MHRTLLWGSAATPSASTAMLHRTLAAPARALVRQASGKSGRAGRRRGAPAPRSKSSFWNKWNQQTQQQFYQQVGL